MPTPRYQLTIFADFASAHTLRNYPGDCSRMHGHNWKVEVEVTANCLDQHEMAMDFKVIKTATRDLAAQLDHRYLNDIPPFDTLNPTAENIAQYFYQQLSTTINTEKAAVSAVTLWETERAYVRYSEES
ncbi:MAG TPA: 6-carboxytetrahydropterin synthase QueD [Gammaproteobacteria bacterium]|nr:6-carboxytetrahydropterin synthase QueD [Gammaproteobacteria bacterium]HAU06983.1 6-carboxytetrahydropterin synthase QueD [Gammaproteobacteria bacterium]